MFAGHIGAALAIGRAERGVNVGVFIAAALLLDFLLWVFVLFGWESVAIPPDIAATHQPEFAFPYSHGLLASAVWSALAGVLAFILCSHLRTRRRIATLVAVAVLSHWVLDALVHRPELPLLGPSSNPFGLALWNNIPFALTLEAALVVVGLYLFISGTKVGRKKTIALCGTERGRNGFHSGWNDDGARSAVGNGYGSEFIGGTRHGLRAFLLVRSASQAGLTIVGGVRDVSSDWCLGR